MKNVPVLPALLLLVFQGGDGCNYRHVCKTPQGPNWNNCHWFLVQAGMGMAEAVVRTPGFLPIVPSRPACPCVFLKRTDAPTVGCLPSPFLLS